MTSPEDQFEGKSQSFLRQINSECKSIYEGHGELTDGINPTYVTIKHELSSYEEEEYFNLASTILSKTAGSDIRKNQQELINYFENNSNFKNLSWTDKFVYWFITAGFTPQEINAFRKKMINRN